MTKKLKYIMSIILLLIFLVGYPMMKNTEKELSIYLEEYLQTTEDIIKIDYSNSGAYIFKDIKEDANVCFFIKKSFWGWKYDHDVNASSLGPLVEQSGFTITSLPKERNVDYPVYFGKILDEEIEKITFRNISTDEIKDVSVTMFDSIKLWTFYIDDLEKDQFIISSYSKSNELISKVEINTKEIKYIYYKNLTEGIHLKTLNR